MQPCCPGAFQPSWSVSSRVSGRAHGGPEGLACRCDDAGSLSEPAPGLDVSALVLALKYQSIVPWADDDCAWVVSAE